MTGGMEESLRSEIRMTKTREAILSSLALAGVVAIGILAPNTLQTLGKVVNRGNKSNIKSAAKSLAAKGLVRFDAKDNTVEITNKGRSYLERVERVYSPITKPARWDRKWRIVIFDIPESRSKQRRHLGFILKKIGFYRLQDSVWVHPYDCEELITLIKTDFRMRKEVLYIIADKIENDAPLRLSFKL